MLNVLVLGTTSLRHALTTVLAILRHIFDHPQQLFQKSLERYQFFFLVKYKNYKKILTDVNRLWLWHMQYFSMHGRVWVLRFKKALTTRWMNLSFSPFQIIHHLFASTTTRLMSTKVGIFTWLDSSDCIDICTHGGWSFPTRKSVDFF